MKLGIIISQTNPETNWNALRLANFGMRNLSKIEKPRSKQYLPDERMKDLYALVQESNKILTF